MEKSLREGPATVLFNWWKRIPLQVRTAFITALIIGALTHFYAFIHLMPNNDFAAVSLFFNKSMLSQGRWFQQFSMLLTSSFNMPWVNGCVSIFLLAVSVGLTVSVAGIRKRSSAALAAGLLVTFPTVAGWFNFLYMTDGFMWALVLAALAVYLSRRMEKYGFLIAAVLLCLSMGIYQALICYAIAMYVIVLILDVLRDKKTCREIITRGTKDLASILLGLALYAAVLFFLLHITGTKLTDYQGIGKMGVASIANIFPQSIIAFKSFFKFFIYETGRTFALPVVVMYWAALLLSIFFGTTIFIKKQLYRQRMKTALLIILLLLAPITFSSAYLLSAERVHSLMIYSVAVFFVLWICLAEEYFGCNPRRNLKSAVAWAVPIVSAVIILGSSILCNQGYLILESLYNQTYAYANRIVSRIEESPYYHEGIPIAFVNKPDSAPELPSVHITGLNNAGSYQLTTKIHCYNFFRQYIGVEFNVVYDVVVDEIKRTDEYKKMKKYPSSDCIALINGVLVVKLGNKP